MAANRGLLLLLLSVAALAGVASAAAASFISDGVLQAGAGSTNGRRLLQAKKDCPMDFEFKNYTGIISRCKGPKYPPKECCGALKEFACPYKDYINDLNTKCADTMFSYINIYGKYPPGLFASECRDDKKGLSCDGVPQQDSASGGQRAQSSSFALIGLMCGLVVLLFH